MIPPPSIECPRCGALLPHECLNTGEFAPCRSCRTPSRAEIFPAFLRPKAVGQAADPILIEGEAGCFYHPQKRAAAHCQSCGRFLCALCDVDMNGQHLCPTCLETGQRKGKIRDLQHRRTLYDGAALVLAVLPLLLWFITIVTAPAAIALAVYGWNKPTSLVPRTRIRAILAILIGLLELGGWALLLFHTIDAP